MISQLELWDQSDPRDKDQEKPLPEALANMNWSYSRRSNLERCVRQYYYDYYGANKRTAKQEGEKEELHFLKQLQNRHECSGKILHLAIGAFLRKGQKGVNWSPERFVSWAIDILNNDIAYSRAYPNGQELLKETYPPTLLSEFYYKDPDAVEKCSVAKDRLNQALLSFLSDPHYGPFRNGGIQSTAVIEKPFKLRKVTPCIIEGRIDLSFPSHNNVTIVDWKLGDEDGIGDYSLQLATYALWAIEIYHCKPQTLRICKIFLGSGDIVDFHCNDALLSAAHTRILQDAERMLFLKTYGQNAVVKAFTPCRRIAVCRLCSFLAVCSEGREIVHT